MAARRRNFCAVVAEAIRDFSLHGFDSQGRLEKWLREIEQAANDTLLPASELQRRVAEHLKVLFDRTLRGRSALLRVHPGVSEFTLRQIEPKLRALLERKIVASVNLITLNQKASRQRALQRFAGWATSIPVGGSRAIDKAEEGEVVRRSIAGLPFEERRVVIDQGHKLVAAIHSVIAVDGGAIAALWHHIHEAGAAYEPRPEHVARAKPGKNLFVIRDNWALTRGLMKLASHQYTDQIEQPAELPFCRCTYEYLYNLRDLPEPMLTAAGKAELARVRAIIRSA